MFASVILDTHGGVLTCWGAYFQEANTLVSRFVILVLIALAFGHHIIMTWPDLHIRVFILCSENRVLLKLQLTEHTYNENSRSTEVWNICSLAQSRHDCRNYVFTWVLRFVVWTVCLSMELWFWHPEMHKSIMTEHTSIQYIGMFGKLFLQKSQSGQHPLVGLYM